MALHQDRCHEILSPYVDGRLRRPRPVLLVAANNVCGSFQVINVNERACESCKCVPHFAIKVNE